MKKILFLILICVIKLNAYEYEFLYRNHEGVGKYYFANVGNGIFVLRRYVLSSTGEHMIQNVSYNINFMSSMNSIRISKVNNIDDVLNANTNTYVNKSIFDSYYKNDLNFLNDLYLNNPLVFLNYLYNENSFSNTNYINYGDYEILYNDDGLAVESIVNGVWAGLYDDSQKSKSGAMYNKNGSMVYYNGKEVTPVTSFLVWLQKFTNRVVIETFEEIQRSLISGIIAAVVLVLAIVRLVLELLPSSITPRRRRYYGGGRGSLPDFGDGLQVSASFRARLAAKNQALKARAYDRSGVEESTVNGILFDLENDR